MKIYLVGGAVRDTLMGNIPKDRDYLVVGATRDEMISKGYVPIDAPFPVFVDPDTQEEYALAGSRRKSDANNLGGEAVRSSESEIAEDLSLRDLTINAMAMDAEGGVLIDPHGGAQDIEDRVLRHTSHAFAEDPVRVLRLARFRARFGADWTVDPSTRRLCRAMAQAGLLGELDGARVWKELSRALGETSPRLFFDTLHEIGALEAVFPVIHAMLDTPEKLKWHPEGTTYEHVMLVIEAARALTDDIEVLFSALCHDFGKTLTDPAILPSHRGHDEAGVELVEAFANRLQVPGRTKRYAMLSTLYHMRMHVLEEMRPKKVSAMFREMNAFNDPRAIEVLTLVGKADARGRLGSHDLDVSHLDLLQQMYEAAAKVRFSDAVDEYCAGQEPFGIQAALLMDRARADAIATAREGAIRPTTATLH